MIQLDKNILLNFLEEKYTSAKIKFAEEGWGSIAFIVDDKIHRFPKGNVSVYKAEEIITNLVRPYIDIDVPKITVYEDFEYKYATHKMLMGRGWKIDEVNKLPADKKQNFFKTSAKFLSDIHKIDIGMAKKIYPVLGETKFGLIPSNEIFSFLKPYFTDNQLDTIYKKYKSAHEQKPTSIVLLHKDFSGSNSLVDDDFKLTGVFDWCNSDFGEREYEFHRLYNPTNNDFLINLLNEYTKITGVHINMNRVIEISLMDTIGAAHYVNFTESLKDMKENEMKWIVDKLKWFL